tara:strand:+ start:2885 stop:3052 length:168 start_codon:yes stop_codon:yes gene_type:complete
VAISDIGTTITSHHLMKRKKAPFKLNIFGLIGILLMLSGIMSGVVVYYSIMEVYK